MLNVVYGRMAEVHDRLFRNPALHEELTRNENLDTSPLLKEYYLYLQSLLPGHDQLDYAQQVSALS